MEAKRPKDDGGEGKRIVRSTRPLTDTRPVSTQHGGGTLLVLVSSTNLEEESPNSPDARVDGDGAGARLT